MRQPTLIRAIYHEPRLSVGRSLGADQSRVRSDPQLERPTLHSLGVYWIVRGDDNRVAVQYRNPTNLVKQKIDKKPENSGESQIRKL
jgi:hypothetical protein